MNINTISLQKNCRHEVWVELRRDERAECAECGILHLMDASIEELLDTACEDCLVNNMAEYACRTHLKDNQPVCVDCCHCPEDDQCDPCPYAVEED
jgi:hypothetical protein